MLLSGIYYGKTPIVRAYKGKDIIWSTGIDHFVLGEGSIAFGNMAIITPSALKIIQAEYNMVFGNCAVLQNSEPAGLYLIHHLSPSVDDMIISTPSDENINVETEINTNTPVNQSLSPSGSMYAVYRLASASSEDLTSLDSTPGLILEALYTDILSICNALNSGVMDANTYFASLVNSDVNSLESIPNITNLYIDTSNNLVATSRDSVGSKIYEVLDARSSIMGHVLDSIASIINIYNTSYVSAELKSTDSKNNIITDTLYSIDNTHAIVDDVSASNIDVHIETAPQGQMQHNSSLAQIVNEDIPLHIDVDADIKDSKNSNIFDENIKTKVDANIQSNSSINADIEDIIDMSYDSSISELASVAQCIDKNIVTESNSIASTLDDVANRIDNKIDFEIINDIDVVRSASADLDVYAKTSNECLIFNSESHSCIAEIEIESKTDLDFNSIDTKQSIIEDKIKSVLTSIIESSNSHSSNIDAKSEIISLLTLLNLHPKHNLVDCTEKVDSKLVLCSSDDSPFDIDDHLESKILLRINADKPCVQVIDLFQYTQNESNLVNGQPYHIVIDVTISEDNVSVMKCILPNNIEIGTNITDTSLAKINLNAPLYYSIDDKITSGIETYLQEVIGHNISSELNILSQNDTIVTLDESANSNIQSMISCVYNILLYVSKYLPGSPAITERIKSESDTQIAEGFDKNLICGDSIIGTQCHFGNIASLNTINLNDWEYPDKRDTDLLITQVCFASKKDRNITLF